MKFALTLLLTTFSFCAFTQIPKGKIMSEVGLQFSKSQQTDVLVTGSSRISERSYFSIFASNRFFFKENSFAALKIAYANSIDESGANKSTSDNFRVGLGIGAVRSIADKFYASVEFNAGLSRRFSRYNSRDYDPENTYSAAIVPELYYQIHPKFLIFVGIGQVEYTYQKYPINGLGFGSTNYFGINLSPRFWNYGFVYLWGGSKKNK